MGEWESERFDDRLCIISREAVDDKNLARRKCRDSLKAPPDVQPVFFCVDYDGCVRHNVQPRNTRNTQKVLTQRTQRILSCRDCLLDSRPQNTHTLFPVCLYNVTH